MQPMQSLLLALGVFVYFFAPRDDIFNIYMHTSTNVDVDSFLKWPPVRNILCNMERAEAHLVALMSPMGGGWSFGLGWNTVLRH